MPHTALQATILTVMYAKLLSALKSSLLNNDLQIYVFKNIRFAAPPVGNLRWAKPAPPNPESSIQDGSYGPICVQAPIQGPQLTGPGASSPIGQALNQFLAGIPIPSFKAASEDCLFLDVYVPAKAVENPGLRLPVISWFYGGAYTFGAKDQFDPILPLYHGDGLIQESGGNVIFVASNYRVGLSLLLRILCPSPQCTCADFQHIFGISARPLHRGALYLQISTCA